MDEFALIKHFFEQPNAAAGKDNPHLLKGIGDDCAVLRVPSDKDLVFSLDTLVEGVHFPLNADAAELAWRLLGAAVSDLAAMGAQPNNFTLALTLPALDQQWLQRFSENLALAANQYQITLAGGDTTKGPLTLSAQVQGFVDRGQALLRNGAKLGDLVCVTGTLGDSRAGLSLLDAQELSSEQRYLMARYYRPEPRVSTGMLIKDYASACIDISDGLLADLGHILNQSEVGAKLSRESIPMSEQMQNVAAEKSLSWALSGGEDFELCFTVPKQKWPMLQQALQGHSVQVSQIGEVVAQAGIQMLQDDVWQQIEKAGFNHFQPKSGD